jgi:hypothetical protein
MTMSAAIPRATTNFSRVRNFEVGLVICLVSMIDLDSNSAEFFGSGGCAACAGFYRGRAELVYRCRASSMFRKAFPAKPLSLTAAHLRQCASESRKRKCAAQ